MESHQGHNCDADKQRQIELLKIEVEVLKRRADGYRAVLEQLMSAYCFFGVCKQIIIFALSFVCSFSIANSRRCHSL